MYYISKVKSHGLRLGKVHRSVKFNQRYWLKPYIDKNTRPRKIFKSDFEKDLFKLMSNAVFGKTMESNEKHRNVQFVTKDKKRNYCISEPNYVIRLSVFEKSY